MSDGRIEQRLLAMERQLRTLRALVAALVTTGAVFVLVGASCQGTDEVLNANDVTVKRLFAERIFIMDSPSDPATPRRIGAAMTMEGESANLVFFDVDGEPSVRLAHTPEIQGLSILNRQNNAEAFIGRIEGGPAVTLYAPGGAALARLRTTASGGAVEALDTNGVLRAFSGMVDDKAIVGVADADGKQIAGLP